MPPYFFKRVTIPIFLLILAFCSFVSAKEETIITYRSAESDSDDRYIYDTKLLQLALETTLSTDGPYKLVPSPEMNFSRARIYVQENRLTNFFIKLTYVPNANKMGMEPVPFPVDLGIVGYRVCFAHPEIVDKLMHLKSLEALKQFSYGQGKGWQDVAILRYNGFSVIEAPTYESLFRMVANRRFDLFCRGANELLSEIESHQDIDNLSYDKSFAFHYDLPRLFYTNTKNRIALDRIKRGILLAYRNGSLQSLWRNEYKVSVDFVKLNRRTIFTLENPFIEGIGINYQQYFFNPLKSD